jgi:hypothetical protein
LLGLESFLGSKDGSGAQRINIVGKLIAFAGEVVLDMASRLILVEPTLAVIIGSPARRQAGHGCLDSLRARRWLWEFSLSVVEAEVESFSRSLADGL